MGGSNLLTKEQRPRLRKKAWLRRRRGPNATERHTSLTRHCRRPNLKNCLRLLRTSSVRFPPLYAKLQLAPPYSRVRRQLVQLPGEPARTTQTPSAAKKEMACRFSLSGGNDLHSSPADRPAIQAPRLAKRAGTCFPRYPFEYRGQTQQAWSQRLGRNISCTIYPRGIPVGHRSVCSHCRIDRHRPARFQRTAPDSQRCESTHF